MVTNPIANTTRARRYKALSPIVAWILMTLTYAQVPTITDDDWESMGVPPGANGSVHTTVLDQSGTFYVGGQLNAIGDVLVSNVAKWQEGEWSPLGSTAGAVDELFFFDGELHAKGEFSKAGGPQGGSLAKWDGAQWAILGSNAVSVSEHFFIGDELHAMGDFNSVGGPDGPSMGKWDGGDWLTLGPDAGPVLRHYVLDDDHYVLGQFDDDDADGREGRFIAKWDGGQWALLGSGLGTDFGNDVDLSFFGDDLFAVGEWIGADLEGIWVGAGSMSITDYDLRLMSVAETEDLPEEGQSLVIVALVNSALHIRIFDASGRIAVDAPEAELLAGEALTDLKRRLKALPFPDDLELSQREKSTFIEHAIDALNSRRIARWDGREWTSLHAGIESVGEFSDLGVPGFGAPSGFFSMNGEIYAVGRYFDDSQGWWSGHVARWDGSRWAFLGSRGHSDWVGYVFDWEVINGELYVLGLDPEPGDRENIECCDVAKWDGTKWSLLGTERNRVQSTQMEVIDNELYSLGKFQKWNGQQWVSFEPNVDGMVGGTLVIGDLLYVWGDFTTVDGKEINHVAKWDGEGWSSLASGTNGPVRELRVSGGVLYAIGGFSEAGGLDARNIAKWDGNAWSPVEFKPGHIEADFAILGGELLDLRTDAIPAPASGGDPGGPDDIISSMAVMGNNLYVAGPFRHAGGKVANGIARWDGKEWFPLGDGVDPVIHPLWDDPTIKSLAVIGDNLYAGGRFTRAGGKTAHGIARWDGTEWWPLGSGLSCGSYSEWRDSLFCYGIYVLAASGSDLYVRGEFSEAGGVEVNNQAIWNGGEWSAPVWSASVPGIPGSYVTQLALFGDDHYALVYREFTHASGALAHARVGWFKWNGQQWSPQGPEFDPARRLFPFGDNLYATRVQWEPDSIGVLKWEGEEWQFMGAGFLRSPDSWSPDSWGRVKTMVEHGGVLYVGGDFETTVGGKPVGGIAMWDGCGWAPLGIGVADEFFTTWKGYRVEVNAMAVLGDYLYVGGSFRSAGGKPSQNIARIKINTPAPEVVAVEIDTTVRVDFTTPRPRLVHRLERSPNLLPGSWQPVPNTSLESIGNLFRFTSVRPADRDSYYRVVLTRRYFSEDFESSAEGWIATTSAGDTEWELGKPAATNLTDAHSGESVYGTDLDAPYTNGATASLRSPVIDLTGVHCANLRFWYFADATIDREGVQLNILDESGAPLFQSRHEDVFWGTSEEWTEFSMPIPTEAAGQKIRLEWLLRTDDTGPDGDGFFLDDVVVE